MWYFPAYCYCSWNVLPWQRLDAALVTGCMDEDMESLKPDEIWNTDESLLADTQTRILFISFISILPLAWWNHGTHFTCNPFDVSLLISMIIHAAESIGRHEYENIKRCNRWIMRECRMTHGKVIWFFKNVLPLGEKQQDPHTFTLNKMYEITHWITYRKRCYVLIR